MSAVVALSSTFRPPEVRPRAIQATGHASVNTDPATVFAGSAVPSGAHRMKPASVRSWAAGRVTLVGIAQEPLSGHDKGPQQSARGLGWGWGWVLLRLGQRSRLRLLLGLAGQLLDQALLVVAVLLHMGDRHRMTRLETHDVIARRDDRRHRPVGA